MSVISNALPLISCVLFKETQITFKIHYYEFDKQSNPTLLYKITEYSYESIRK